MSESFKVVREAVSQYRDDCIRDGYSESAAEAMAVDVHHVYMYLVYIKKPDTGGDDAESLSGDPDDG